MEPQAVERLNSLLSKLLGELDGKKDIRDLDAATATAVKRPNATINESADFLGVSKRSIWNYVARGLLKPVRFGRRVLVPWSQLSRLAKTGVR